jgi:hypothetical protein
MILLIKTKINWPTDGNSDNKKNDWELLQTTIHINRRTKTGD